MLFVGKLQDKALEDGYLEKLFLKESHEQGSHFEIPASITKIVRPPLSPSLTIPSHSPFPSRLGVCSLLIRVVAPLYQTIYDSDGRVVDQGFEQWIQKLQRILLQETCPRGPSSRPTRQSRKDRLPRRLPFRHVPHLRGHHLLD